MKRLIVFVTVMTMLAMGSWVWAADTIKIGVVGPRTGPAAATGKAFEEGIAIALDHINAKGGVLGKQVEVVFEDIKCPSSSVRRGTMTSRRRITNGSSVQDLPIAVWSISISLPL